MKKGVYAYYVLKGANIMENRVIKKILVILLTVVLLMSFAACGGNTAAEGKTQITFYAGITADSGDAYAQMVKLYNETQGVLDGVYVNYKPKASGYDSDLSTVFASKNPPDVLAIEDQHFKGYSKKGSLYNIQTLVNDPELVTKNANGEVNLDLSKIPDVMLDRFRIDWENGTAGNKTDDLYAIPNGANPTFLYYNIDAFSKAGVNIISVAEEDLDAYNSANGTSYMPHGYAEYDVSAAPAQGLVTSKNLTGKQVVKVFNNQIPMNWNELVVLSKYLTKSYTADSVTQYGFLTEWWFSHGWSVGGDCMRWDPASGQYIFSLGNTDPGYLAVADVTINGTAYKAGDVISNVDKAYLAANPAAVTDALHQLPSQYDAFAEFCALSQATGKSVDLAGKRGYGISPSPAKLGSYSKPQFFTAQNVAMLVEQLTALPNIARAASGRFQWDIAPVVQYREYQGGDMNADGSLKTIGVDGYTGELLKINDVPVVGLRSASNKNSSFIIPAAAANPEAAYKFIQWAAGPEAQLILANSNTQVPNYVETGLSEEFLSASERACSNYRIAVEAIEYEQIGDWAYLEDGQWVNYWSNILNTDVRNGDMLLDAFFANETVTEYANINLGKYEIHINGK